jgi:hypothetical protein
MNIEIKRKIEEGIKIHSSLNNSQLAKVLKSTTLNQFTEGSLKNYIGKVRKEIENTTIKNDEEKLVGKKLTGFILQIPEQNIPQNCLVDLFEEIGYNNYNPYTNYIDQTLEINLKDKNAFKSAKSELIGYGVEAYLIDTNSGEIIDGTQEYPLEKDLVTINNSQYFNLVKRNGEKSILPGTTLYYSDSVSDNPEDNNVSTGNNALLDGIGILVGKAMTEFEEGKTIYLNIFTPNFVDFGSRNETYYTIGCILNELISKGWKINVCSDAGKLDQVLTVMSIDKSNISLASSYYDAFEDDEDYEDYDYDLDDYEN